MNTEEPTAITDANQPKYRYPSDTPEYKKRYYRLRKARNRRKGLNARGRPFARSNMSQVMKASWARRKASQPQDGATTRDMTGEAARKILEAAAVIRAVSTHLKLFP